MQNTYMVDYLIYVSEAKQSNEFSVYTEVMPAVPRSKIKIFKWRRSQKVIREKKSE